MASALRATNLHAHSYISCARIATPLLSPFSNRVGRSVPKQRAQQMRSFQAKLSEFNVKLVMPDETEKNMTMAGHKHILQEALKENIDVNHDKDCLRAGLRCSDCVGKLIKGQVEHSGKTILRDNELKEGYVALCRAIPKSNVEIKTHIDITVIRKGKRTQ